MNFAFSMNGRITILAKDMDGFRARGLWEIRYCPAREEINQLALRVPEAFDRGHIGVFIVAFGDRVERVPQRIFAENLQGPTSEPADHLNL